VEISFDLHAGFNDLVQVLGDEVAFVQDHDHFAFLLVLHAIDAHRVGKIAKFAAIDILIERCVLEPAVSILAFINVEQHAFIINDQLRLDLMHNTGLLILWLIISLILLTILLCEVLPINS
jgi:hypothetical protein